MCIFFSNVATWLSLFDIAMWLRYVSFLCESWWLKGLACDFIVHCGHIINCKLIYHKYLIMINCSCEYIIKFWCLQWVFGCDGIFDGGAMVHGWVLVYLIFYWVFYLGFVGFLMVVPWWWCYDGWVWVCSVFL